MQSSFGSISDLDKDELAPMGTPDQPDMSLDDVGFNADRMKQIQEKDTLAVEDSPLQPDEPVFIKQYESPDVSSFIEQEPDLVPTVKDSLEKEHIFYTLYDFPVPKDKADKEINESKMKGKFNILLLADSFMLCHEGISAVNRCLASQLVSTNAGTVTSTVYEPIDKLNFRAIEAAKKLNVKLISLGDVCKEYRELNDEPINLYQDVVFNPLKYTKVFDSPDPSEKFLTYTHIVGHVPITHEFALSLKMSTFRLSKLFLFFHVIPGEMTALKDTPHSQINVPTIERLIEIAKIAEVVYSVSRKVFDYFTIVFRTHNIINVNHRLYLPSAPIEVFNLTFRNSYYNKLSFLTNGFLCDSSEACKTCNGLDISLDILMKLSKENIPVEDSNEKMILELVISHLNEEEVQNVKRTLSTYGDTSVIGEALTDPTDMSLLAHQSNFYLCPKRCENYGFQGLYPFCVGVPTIVPEDSITASIISQVYEDAHEFIAPVYKNPRMYKQNSEIWCKKLKIFIQNYEQIKLKAKSLKQALMSDENTRNNHDDFLSCILGGIRMKIRVVSLVPLDTKEQDRTSMKIMVEDLMVKILRVCWRLKSHESEACTDHSYMGSQIVTGAIIPIDRFIHEVFDKIEDYNRRVVSIDNETKSLVVFCPTQVSLRHLWAKCSNISRSFENILDDKSECNSLLSAMKIKSVKTELIIEGSEFFELSQFLENVYEKM